MKPTIREVIFSESGKVTCIVKYQGQGDTKDLSPIQFSSEEVPEIHKGADLTSVMQVLADKCSSIIEAEVLPPEIYTN